MLIHKSKKDQQIQKLFDEKFTENKPIPFPSGEQNYAYSNLFYWAHLVAHKTGEFPLHEHKGFEIMTFVLKGSLEHYDTASNRWTPVQEGGFQVIQAGSGVMHAERIMKGSELFQIWFDPDLSKTLTTNPAYQDYTKDDALDYQDDGVEVLEYIGAKNTLDINITRVRINKKLYTKTTDKSSMSSIYVIEGEGKITSKNVIKDDYIIVKDVDSIEFETESVLDLFIIQSPKNLSYKRFRE
jgi:quercetin 2,3-dioxygenase